MAHHFDHRWATFDGEDFREVSPVEKRDPAFTVMPRYWVPMGEVETRAPGRQWFCGWRDISRSTDERTFIGSVIPWSGAGNTFRLFRATSEQFVLSVIIQSSSFIQDFVARVKFGGTHATLTPVKQLPALHLNEGDIRFVRAAIAELAYTAWDMAGFATFLGCSSPPFIWNAERRALIRAELDALMFRAYGIRRDDV